MFSHFQIQINRACYFLKTSKKILLVSHARPDGDTIGANLALALGLKKIGKETLSLCPDNLPQRFHFLPQIGSFKKTDQEVKKIPDFDLTCFIDCGDFCLSGLCQYYHYSDFPSFIINIDHHQDNPYYGQINIINEKASSTSEIVYHLLKQMGVVFDKDIATCLLAGIFTDTDSFRNPNTSLVSLKITSSLLNLGANLKKVTKNLLLERSMGALKLWGRVLSRAEKNKKYGILSSVISLKDFAECGADESDLEGISNCLNCVPEVKATLLLREKENGLIKGSLRTLKENINVARLAKIFGGGGHRSAAAFIMPGKLTRKEGKWKVG